jgi:predicted nucleotidyltransferase
MPDELPDFERLLNVLKEQNAQFIVVGGLAMVAHGSAHITSDLDVSYSRGPENLAAVAEALAPLHPRLRGAPEGLPFRLDARTLRGGANFTLVTDAGDLDLLADLAGTDGFDGLWERSVEVELFGMKVRVASLGDLISMKRAAARSKDQAHLLELEALKRMKDR